MNRKVGSEYLYAVTLLALYVGDIDHTYIHAYVAHIIGFLAVDQAVGVAVAQMAVQTVGITNRYGGYARVSGYLALTAVTHGLTLFQLADLQYGGLEGTYGLQRLVVKRVDAVKTQTQTYHVIVYGGEPLYT